ncbi:adhesion G-protein coupled receptor G2-like [Mercenaria mercenaria]|uniref:adhesion G-protein coupled receptor G2-like n=1 Tax=Mercenaria mercenaria TaxID=6596 RepID=UPI00234E868E|nr:adhesion G-protein coupled receptor G2-like [Mercenaria mercenaria]
METKPASEKVKATLRSLCVLLPIMGISWIVGLFYIDDSSDSVQYIFAILNGLQGFFIFLFHCLLNKQIREAIKLRQKRQSSKIANQISVKRSTLTADSSQERSKGSTDGLRYIGESRHQLVREASASTEYSFTEPFGSHEFTTYTTVEPQNNLNNGTMKQEVMFPGEDLTSGMMRQNLYIRRDKSKSTLTADSSQESSKGPTYSRHYIGESRHQSIREASSATEHSLTEPCDSRDFATLTNVEPQDNLNNGTTKHEEMFPVEDINLFTDFINHRSDATKPLFQAQHDNGVSIDQINQISHIDID